MNFRRSVAAISLVGLLGFSSALCAQQTKTPTLDQILQKLEANLNHYDRGIPSLFCDEHVVSREGPSRTGETVTDSVFRLRRMASARQTTTLVESREIKAVNGKPPTSQTIRGPSLVSGVFEGGLAVVSLNQRACMKYELQPIHADSPGEPYVIRFSTLRGLQNHPDCLLHEKSSGRVMIDPASMQIKRLELTTPHHLIVPGNQYGWPVVGKWFVTIEYAPVVLGGDMFWTPSMITSQDTSTEGTKWSFQATYTNYHRLEVKSRILPGGKELAP